jgi:hypothetical protein
VRGFRLVVVVHPGRREITASMSGLGAGSRF